MADFALSSDSYPTAVGFWTEAVLRGARLSMNFWSIGAGPPGPVSKLFFKMRGQDAATNGLYDAWLATVEPDYSAALYTGALAKPLRDIVVIDQWEH